MRSDSELPLKITDDDLDRAVVGRIPVSRPLATARPEPPAAANRNWNGVAMAALVAALVATFVAGIFASFAEEIGGIAAFGAVAGMAAIVLGCAALARPSRPNLRGTGLAISGIVAGVASVVGWMVVWSVFGLPAGVMSVAFEPDPQALEKLPPPLQRAMKANVLIEGRTGWNGLGGQTVGSGVILRIADGKAYVVTNRHVVDHGFKEGSPAGVRGKVTAGPVTIKLVGQAAQPAAVEWVAPDGIDLAVAVVDVQSGDPQSADWDPDVAAQIGDEVFAIGNPHGLAWTHTAGAISQFRQQNLRGRTIQVIQTNTAINPGNSGGGLYDKQGHLVGITTWTQDKRVSEGLSFAIAFETLRKLNPEVLNLAAGKAP